MYGRFGSRYASLRPWALAWGWLFALAWLLTIAVETDVTPDEAAVVREVQGWSFPGEGLSDAVRAVTSTPFVIAAGAVVVVVHWLSGDRRSAVVLAVLLFLLPAAQTGIKEVVDRPRPSEAAEGIEVRASQTSPSYPAGHVMGPMVVYGWAVVVLARGRWRRVAAGADGGERALRAHDAEVDGTSATVGWVRPLAAAGAWGLAIVLAGVVVLTGPVNVWLGVHWPTDVIAGYVWGAVLLLPALAMHKVQVPASR